MIVDDLKYPIGKYDEQPFSEKLKEEWIAEIAVLPQHLELVMQNLDVAQLHTAYRPGGWTVNQLVHHVADSHMNAFCRFKFILTENDYTIKAYKQDKWAGLPDTQNLPVNISITLLFALHKRWVEILKNIPAESWNRTAFHPVHNKMVSLWYLLGSYAWHGKHHVAHIQQLRKRMNW